MKWFLLLTITVLAVLARGDVIAQGNSTLPCRARTLDLRAEANFWDEKSKTYNLP